MRVCVAAYWQVGLLAAVTRLEHIKDRSDRLEATFAGTVVAGKAGSRHGSTKAASASVFGQ